MSRLSYHEKSDKRKWIAVSLILVLIIAAIVSGVCTDWYTEKNKFCLFGHDYGEDNKCIRCGKDKPIEEFEQANGSVVLNTVMASGMRLNSAPAVAAANEEQSYTLTATITPASADDKRVEWTVAWKDADSAWANGKIVTEYVTVTATSANALTATVACLKDFGEQVIVTVMSLDNSEVTAQCTVDYVEKITGFTFNMPAVASAENAFTYNIETSNYTLKSDIAFNISDELSLSEEFITAYKVKFNSISNELNILPAKLVKQDSNKLLIKSADFVNLSPMPWDDYFYPDGLVGLFIGIDGQDFAVVLNNDEGLLIKAFRDVVNSITTCHATFDITYSATYNGKTYSSGTKTVQVTFDGDALHIPVENVTLDNGSIII